MLESLQVFKYEPEPHCLGRYTALYDFQWRGPSGCITGFRVAVETHVLRYLSSVGQHSDYFRRILPFGTLALRCLGDGTDFLRAELRIADRFYELPILQGTD